MKRALLLLSLVVWAPRIGASQTLETETARLLLRPGITWRFR